MPISEELPPTSTRPPVPRNGHDAHPTVPVNGHDAVPHRARTLGPWFLVLIVALFFGAVKLFIHERKPAVVDPSQAKAPPVVTVATQKVVYRQVPRQLVVTGSISAWDQLPIGSEANGLRIAEVNVEEGDTVHKGQVMAVLDSSVLQAQRRQMMARLSSAQAAIPKAMQPNRPQDIAGLQSALLQAQANAHQQGANLVQARANLENARKNHKRYQQLLAQGYVTTKEFEDRQTELDRNQALVLAAQDAVRAADFAVEQTRQRLALATAGGRVEDVAIARASHEEIQASLQQLDALIAQTVIRAPDDGLVIKRDAHIGDITGANKTLFTIVRRNQLELRAQLPEVDLARVKVGQRVQLTRDQETPLGASPATVLEKGAKAAAPVFGRIWLINPVIDPQTRLGTARIAIPTNVGLRPGMFVRAQIDGGHDQALVVPSRAIQGGAEDRYALVVEGDKVRRQAVSTGGRSGDDVQVLSGLKAGDEVVIDGGGFLSDGDVVRVAPPGTALPSPAASAKPAEK